MNYNGEFYGPTGRMLRANYIANELRSPRSTEATRCAIRVERAVSTPFPGSLLRGSLKSGEKMYKCFPCMVCFRPCALLLEMNV